MPKTKFILPSSFIGISDVFNHRSPLENAYLFSSEKSLPNLKTFLTFVFMYLTNSKGNTSSNPFPMISSDFLPIILRASLFK